MKERGLIFCQALVPAVLDGRKTVTRRLGGPKEINEHPDGIGGAKLIGEVWHFYDHSGNPQFAVKCPHGVPGDRFYIREAWADPPGMFVQFKADGPQNLRWKSSRFMPKAVARPQRWEFISIRPERLHEITVEDIIAEGLSSMLIEHDACVALREKFKAVWDKINAKRGYPWEKNPWVWRVKWNPEPVTT